MPKPNTPPSGSADIKDFVPTGPENIDDIFAGIGGEAPPVVEPKPTIQDTPAPPAPPIEDDDDAPENIKDFVPQEFDIKEGKPKPRPGKAEKKDEHVPEIRKQLEKVAAEKKAAEEELQRLRDSHKEYESRYKEVETQRDSLATEYEEFKKKNSIGDPRQIKEVQDIIRPYRASVGSLMQEMEDEGVEDAAHLESWLEQAVPAFMRASATDANGARNDETYRAELDRLRNEATEKFGQEFTRHVMKHVRTGAENAFAAAKVVQEVQSNIPVHHYREAQRVYETEATEFEQIERTLFNPPDDIKLNDPLNVSVILRAMIDGSEEVKKVAQNAKLATKLGMLPAKPVDPNSVEPERLQDVIKTTLSTHQQHYKKIRSILPEALVCRAVLPAMWKRIQELEAAVREGRDVPKPKLDGQHLDDQREPKEISVTEFEPENPHLAEFTKSKRR